MKPTDIETDLSQTWNEERIDIVGLNGNDGLVYHHLHKHGHRPKSGSSPTYLSWISMKKRCLNPGNDNYYLYGGRGIKICERWFDFINFLADMGERPKDHTIDRIDPYGNYEPSNCRWATSREQALNRVNVSQIEFNGELLTLKDISDKYGIPATTIYRRWNQGVRGDDLISDKNRNTLRIGELCHSSKLKESDVAEIKAMLQRGETQKSCADKYQVSPSVISDVFRGKAWGHVAPKVEVVQPYQDDFEQAPDSVWLKKGTVRELIEVLSKANPEAVVTVGFPLNKVIYGDREVQLL